MDLGDFEAVLYGVCRVFRKTVYRILFTLSIDDHKLKTTKILKTGTYHQKKPRVMSFKTISSSDFADNFESDNYVRRPL